MNDTEEGTMPEAREEVKVGLCPEDFQEGDRIYWRNERGNIHFGTVTTHNWHQIRILPDETSWHMNLDRTEVEKFDRIFGYIGKPLQISQLQPDSRISYFEESTGKRLYVQVTEYVPGEYVQGYYEDDEQSRFTAIQGENITIEYKLVKWQIED